MRLVPTIDDSWSADIMRWQDAQDFKDFILGEQTFEELWANVVSGKVIFLGLEEDGFRGFATIEPHDSEAELTLYAPGNKAKKAIALLTRFLKRYDSINKIYMRVRADRLKKWQEYNKKDWDRITRYWNLKFVGLVGDPIGDKPYYVLAAKEIDHG